MYLEYFSLERHPFRITPDTSLFFSGGDEGRGVVLEAMLYAIETGEGILKVVGEVGSGKTMLCRMLEERLPETTEIVYLANPNLNPDEILYAVAFELKLPVRRDTSKLLVMQQLQNYLLRQHAANRKVLVVIEEAQGMPVETLEEIRLFSNLETHRDKLMQIILFGQPELDKNLSARNIRQLRERITHSFHLNPLTKRETADYIRFRLSAAGCPCPQLLTPKAEWLIAKAASGLTRRINILADKALLAAFAQNVRDGKGPLTAESPPAVGVKHVIAAIQDSEYSASMLHAIAAPMRLLGASMLVALVAVFLLWPESGPLASQTDEQSPAVVDEPEVSVNEVVSAVPDTPAPLDEIVLPVKEVIDPIPVASSPASLSAENAVSVATHTTTVATTQSVAPHTTQHTKTATEPASNQDSNSAWAFATSAFEDEPFVTELSSGAQFEPSSRSLLQERVLASIAWLNQTAGAGYTVQFLSGDTSDLKFAEAFLQELKAADLLQEAYVCMSADAVSSYWTIKYGSFSGMSTAEQFVEQLPAHIKNYKPFVQNISGVVCNSNNTIAALMLE